jgi:predicted Zn-dependent protease
VARFFDGERAVAWEVTPKLAGDVLLLQATDGTTMATWPIRGIVAVSAPDERGAVTFALDRQPARLVIADPTMLTALAHSGVRVRRHMWRVWHWFALAGGTLAVMVATALMLDLAPRLMAPLIPTAWEGHLGDLVEAALTSGHRVCKSLEGQRALDTLVGKLSQAGGIGPIVRIEVVDDAMVNAFTLPGGRVIVMRGLISTAGDGAELAGVVAHELGHVAHRDPTVMLLRELGIGFVAASLGWNDALGGAGGIARDLVTLSYSRDAEAAADASGEMFLARAGLRADGLGRFFARLETVEAHGTIPWLAAHPPTEERRAHATRSIAGAQPLSDAEWAAVRQMCKR